MTLTEIQLKSLTEHAVAARLFADEMALAFPGMRGTARAEGVATGWQDALILLGGTMPDLNGGAA